MAENVTTSILSELIAAQFKPPLEIFSVSNRGVPNQERVNLRVNARTYLGDYFIHAGYLLPNNRALPVPNLSLWLGEDTIDAGSWVIIYTGRGQQKLMTQTIDTKEPVLILHWQAQTTMFQDSMIVPVLVKIDTNATQFGRAGG